MELLKCLQDGAGVSGWRQPFKPLFALWWLWSRLDLLLTCPRGKKKRGYNSKIKELLTRWKIPPNKIKATNYSVATDLKPEQKT